MEGGV